MWLRSQLPPCWVIGPASASTRPARSSPITVSTSVAISGFCHALNWIARCQVVQGRILGGIGDGRLPPSRSGQLVAALPRSLAWRPSAPRRPVLCRRAMTASAARLIEPTFWTQTLEDRMAEFAEIRELGAVLPIEVTNPLADDAAETLYALPRFDEVVHVSKHPDQFCSGKGAHIGVRHADGDARVLRRIHQHGQPAPRPPATDRRLQLHAGRIAGSPRSRSSRSVPK